MCGQPGRQPNAPQCFPRLCLQPRTSASETLPNSLLAVPRVHRRAARPASPCMHFNAAGRRACPSFSSRPSGPASRANWWSPRPRPESTAAPWTRSPRRHSAARSAPDDPDWAARVRARVGRDRAQLPLEKLVLTRRVEVQLAAARASISRILEWLAAHFPESTVFAVRRPGISLLGASPECLLGLEHGLVVADALAGSAPRASCKEADQALGSGALLGDRKELAEHAVVVREIPQAPSNLCAPRLVAYAHSPSLLRLANVQHLASHVHGRVKAEVGVFELLERMHPTPAVGGAPRAARARLAAAPRRKRSRLVYRRRRLAGRNRWRYLGCAALCSPARAPGEPLCRGGHRGGLGSRSRNCARRAGSSRPCSRRSPLTDYAGAGDAGGSDSYRRAVALLDGLAAAGLAEVVLSPGSRSTPLALAAARCACLQACTWSPTSAPRRFSRSASPACRQNGRRPDRHLRVGAGTLAARGRSRPARTSSRCCC
jgi:hypothetical protein